MVGCYLYLWLQATMIIYTLDKLCRHAQMCHMCHCGPMWLPLCYVSFSHWGLQPALGEFQSKGMRLDRLHMGEWYC